MNLILMLTAGWFVLSCLAGLLIGQCIRFARGTEQPAAAPAEAMTEVAVRADESASVLDADSPVAAIR